MLTRPAPVFALPITNHMLPRIAPAISPSAANHALPPQHQLAGGYLSNAAKHLWKTIPQGMGQDEELGLGGQEATDAGQSLAEGQQRRKACCGLMAAVG